MWMISSSRGKACLQVGICMFLGILLFVQAEAFPQDLAPDAPRPARPAVKPPKRAAQGSPSGTVELRSVTVRRLDAKYEKLAGPEFLRTATEPLVIEVRTLSPLGNLARTSSPVIVLNGKQLSETIPLSPNTLLAFLPDRKLIRTSNSVRVEWLGDEALTRSRRPLIFRSRDVNR
jgi:hypothetical protein